MHGKADPELLKALAELDPYILIPALVHSSGERTLLDEAMPYAMRAGRAPGDLPAPLRARMGRLLETVLAGATEPASPGPDLLRQMVEFCTGVQVPEPYLPLLLEESGAVTRALDVAPELPEAKRKAKPVSVAIIGAGLFGIAIAVYLKKAGIPFVIYEKNDGVGGTWFNNRYPGCGVDTTSHFYVYSFALNPAWPRYFSKQPDVLGYIERCADRFGLREHIRFNASVNVARYDEKAKTWRLGITDRGESVHEDASILISCVGQLNVPSTPRIPGLDSFEGPVVHTARWTSGLACAGKRVALLGTGASAVQVGPSIAPDVDQLLVFQRSPQWLSSRPNYHRPVSSSDLWAFENVPNYLQWHRLGLIWQFSDRLYPALLLDGEGRVSEANHQLRELWAGYIRAKLADRPDLLEKAMPDYPPLAKRVPVDFGWLDMLKRDNVRLVTDGIDRVEADGIVTEDNRHYPIDMIVLATGFHATRMLHGVRIEGRGCQELQDVWHGDDARAYLGMTVPGFPNLFVMYGPNTNLAHGGSLIFQGECQARYIVSALRHLVTSNAGEMECRTEIFEAYNAEADAQLSRMVWNMPGVNNWFKNSRGRVVTNSPWSLLGYWQRTRYFEPADFTID